MSEAERAAAFVGWLHDQGYGYLGDQRIGRLTPHEVDVLTLAHLVERDQVADAHDDARRDEAHSKSFDDTRQLMHERSEQVKQQHQAKQN